MQGCAKTVQLRWIQPKAQAVKLCSYVQSCARLYSQVLYCKAIWQFWFCVHHNTLIKGVPLFFRVCIDLPPGSTWYLYKLNFFNFPPFLGRIRGKVDTHPLCLLISRFLNKRTCDLFFKKGYCVSFILL